MYWCPNPTSRIKKDQQENKESTINAITIQMIEDLLSKVLASILPAGASPTP